MTMMPSCWLDGVVQNNSATDRFIHDLKRSISDDNDLFIILDDLKIYFDSRNESQINQEISNGTAQHLARCLHHCIMLRPYKSSKIDRIQKIYYRNKLERIQASEVAILCIAIDRILNCSKSVLEANVKYYEFDLCESLPRIVKLIHKAEVQDAVRLKTLGATINVARRCYALFSAKAQSRLLEALLDLIKNYSQSLPDNILVTSAYMVASFSRKETIEKHKLVRDLVEENSSELISILSTAVGSSNLVIESLDGLLFLAESPVIGAKLIKRRYTVLNIVKHYKSSDCEIKDKALHLTSVMLQRYNSSTKFDRPSLFGYNLRLVKEALIPAFLDETDSTVRISMVRSIHQLLFKKCLDCDDTVQILDALYKVASSDVPEVLATEISTSFLVAAGKVPMTSDILRKTVYFSKSRFAKVRACTLWLIKDVCFFNTETARCLIEETDAFDTFGDILTNGSENDRLGVVEICRQLITVDRMQPLICDKTSFLEALVRFVTKDPNKSRKAHAISVEILLKLMSTKRNISSFLPFTTVLPWLVKLANRTSDDELKTELVDAIVYLTSAILNKAYEV